MKKVILKMKKRGRSAPGKLASRKQKILDKRARVSHYYIIYHVTVHDLTVATTQSKNEIIKNDRCSGKERRKINFRSF